jgi:hypothetical protein
MSQSPPISGAATQRRLILVGVAGGLIFLALVCVALGITLFTRSRSPSIAGRATPAPTQGPSAPVLIAGSAGTIPLTLTAPSRIEIKSRGFEVIPVEVAKGAWPYQRGTLGDDKAIWVFGTLINYVIGLEASPSATTLLQDLTEADVITMTTYSGRAVLFRYSGRQWVTVDKTDVFRQMRPGLTLVLLGETGDDRLVVSATYLAEGEATPVGIALAKVGALVDVAGARVSAIDGRLIRNVAGLPVGNAYYQVDFSVTATGPGALDASLFQMELSDAAGKRYALSVPASQAGSYGLPGGQLLPGITLTATAGFVVPDDLPGANVIWIFSPRVGDASPARFQLAVAGPPPTPDPRSRVVVQVTGARYSNDTAEIIISGGAGNSSKEPVTISLSDISLQAGDLLVQVTVTEPGLPWVLQPGQNLAFTIRFARPPAGTAVFRMLQSSFELSGLE